MEVVLIHVYLTSEQFKESVSFVRLGPTTTCTCRCRVNTCSLCISGVVTLGFILGLCVTRLVYIIYCQVEVSEGLNVFWQLHVHVLV